MKLLFDQNLAPALVGRLSDKYPDSVHCQHIGLGSAADESVWDYALRHGLIVVSKDADFSERGQVHGHPPKVIWIRRGNCSTKVIEDLLRRHYEEVLALAADNSLGILVLI